MDLIISTSTAKAVAKSVTTKGAELTQAQRQEVVATLMKYVGKVPAFTFTKGKTKTQVNAKYGKTNVVLELGSVVYSPKGKIEKIGLRLGTAQKYLVIGLVAETKLKLNALANMWFKGVAGFTKLPTAPKAKPATVDVAPTASTKPAISGPVFEPGTKPTVRALADILNPLSAGKWEIKGSKVYRITSLGVGRKAIATLAITDGKLVISAEAADAKTVNLNTKAVVSALNATAKAKAAVAVNPLAGKLAAPAKTPKAVTKEPAARANHATKVTPKALPKDKQPHAHKQGKEIKVKVTPLKSQSGKKHKVAI